MELEDVEWFAWQTDGETESPLGMVVAVKTENYEIHLTDDGTSAYALYPWALGDSEESFGQMLDTLNGMGFGFVIESGFLEAHETDDGTEGLEWDRFVAA